MGGDRFSSGDGSARGGRSRGRRHRRRHRRTVGETHRSGYDAGKKIKGGKRHIVTDTGGLPVAVMAHEADIRDRAGAPDVLASTAISYPWPSHIFADGGYGGRPGASPARPAGEMAPTPTLAIWRSALPDPWTRRRMIHCAGRRRASLLRGARMVFKEPSRMS